MVLESAYYTQCFYAALVSGGRCIEGETFHSSSRRAIGSRKTQNYGENETEKSGEKGAQ